MNKNKEIKILGAGISGLTSAIVLSKAGYNVEIYERNSDIGERFSGDFQGLMNWGFKEDALDFMKRIGLNTNFWNKAILKMSFCGPNNFKKNFKTKKASCYLVQRGTQKLSLDQSLKKQALDNGVKIIFNADKKEEDVNIIAKGPNFDGVTDGLVMGYTFKTDLQDTFVMIFDDNLACDGYSYFMVADGNATIATCIFRKYKEVSSFLDKTFDFVNKNYSFNIKNKKRFSGTGNFYLFKSKKRYIGEAGGFQDFLWGFGMRYAMITGNFAARSIIENRNYYKLCKKELNGLLKTSITNRFLFALLEKTSYRIFINILKRADNPINILTKIYRPNIFSRMLYPIAKIYFGKNIKDRTSK